MPEKALQSGISVYAQTASGKVNWKRFAGDCNGPTCIEGGRIEVVLDAAFDLE